MLSDHQIVRQMRYVPVVAVLAALVIIGPVGGAQAHTKASPAGTAALASGVTLETEQPELTAAEKDLVVKVRLAGLWEVPGGKMAMEKGVAPRVREIGQMIASQHVRLDAIVRKAAKELNVELPNQPTAQQRRWLDEMSDAEGTAFDDIFVQRLRVAHGGIFPVIGVVRSATENEIIRKLAQSANAFVLTHLTLLESTGLVRYEELPKVAAPATGPIASAASRSAAGGLATPVIWMILAVALISGAIFTTRMIRPQSFGGRHKGRGREPMNTGPIPVQPADHYYPPQGLRLSGNSRSLH